MRRVIPLSKGRAWSMRRGTSLTHGCYKDGVQYPRVLQGRGVQYPRVYRGGGTSAQSGLLFPYECDTSAQRPPPWSIPSSILPGIHPSWYTLLLYTTLGTPLLVHYRAGYAADLGTGRRRRAWAQRRETVWVGERRRA